MALQIGLDIARYKKSKSDVSGAPATIYYGFTENQNAVAADAEWAVMRETVVAGVTSYDWAAHSAGKPEQRFVWDNRATLSY